MLAINCDDDDDDDDLDDDINDDDEDDEEEQWILLKLLYLYFDLHIYTMASSYSNKK